jgi:hypothetical protein
MKPNKNPSLFEPSLVETPADMISKRRFDLYEKVIRLESARLVADRWVDEFLKKTSR